MSIALDQPMSDQSVLTDLPPTIVEMLRDEANLSTAKRVLEEARQDCLTRQEAARAQRPTLGFLGSKKQRDDYHAALNQVTAQLDVIDKMHKRVAAARERLQPVLRAVLAEYLSQTDNLYRQGQRAVRFHNDWLRTHAVVADRLQAFVRDARELRNAMADDVGVGRSRHSNETTWRLGNARAAAAELDRAINDLNKTVSDHAASVEGTPFVAIRLPFLEPWNCIAPLDTLIGRAPIEAMVEADRLLNDFAEFRQPSLETLKAMFNAATGDHAHLTETCLRQRWDELLAIAEIHLVTDAELEPTLASIERRQNEAERARLNSRYPNRPFSSER